jgi:hypothetical protein
VTGTPTTAVSPAAGTLVTATVTCAAGKVVLGGGALVTVSSAALEQFVALRTSYPSAADTWTAVAVVMASLPIGQSTSVTAYALCSL